MSSLLQFNGKTDARGVHLVAYHVRKITKRVGDVEYESWEDVELDANGRSVLWTFPRKPCGMFGCWVQFRINGSVHAPDLSVPYRLFKLPRDARRLTDEEATAYWESE